MRRELRRADRDIVRAMRAVMRGSDEARSKAATELYHDWHAYRVGCAECHGDWPARRGQVALYRADMRALGQRVGQTMGEAYHARAATLERDWNALADAVYEGGARGVMTAPTPDGARMSDAWRTALRSSIDAWRSMRDELAQTWMVFGSVWGPRLDEAQRDVERYRRELRETAGVRLPESSDVPAPGAVEGAARDVARGLGRGVMGAAAVGGVALLLVGGYLATRD